MSATFRSIRNSSFRFAALVLGLLAGTAATAAAPEANPDRDAYFGETHVHTSWSFDAFIFGTTMTGPEEAYKFALGETIKHPAGYDIKITRPLDFMAVTDHSEYAGTVRLANDPSSELSKLPIAEKLKVRDKCRHTEESTYCWRPAIDQNEPIKELVAPAVAGSVWKRGRQDRRQVLSTWQVHDLCRV